MKKTLLFVFGFLAIVQLQAQNGVAISTSSSATPNASAILDVQSTTQGMLIPRVDIPDLSAAAPVTSPATSLMVYNTNTTTGPGFFYWNGTAWVNSTGAKSIDELTDGVASNSTVALGLNAGNNGTGSFNVAVGLNALKLGTGTENVVVGADAGAALTTGAQNTFIGSAAAELAVGGTGNVGVGKDVLNTLSSGDNNIMLGIGSGAITTGSGNIVIGKYPTAVASGTADNQMNIGNAIYATGLNGTSAKIGIGNGNNAPTSTLDVGGSITYAVAAGGTITLDETHYIYRCNSDGTIVTLPTASGIEGRTYIIKYTGGGTGCTLSAHSGETIDGSLTHSLAQWKYMMVVCTGTGVWNIIGQN